MMIKARDDSEREYEINLDDVEDITDLEDYLFAKEGLTCVKLDEFRNELLEYVFGDVTQEHMERLVAHALESDDIIYKNAVIALKEKYMAGY